MTAPPRPVRRHRRITRATRWGGRALAAGLVVAALLAGGEINAHVPDTDQRERAFVHAGAAGAPVDARTFTATVLGVRGGTKLSGGGQAHDTSGVWLLVRVRLTARTTPVMIGYAALVDAQDRRYLATGRITQSIATGGRLLQPGIPVTGEIAFEVPVPVVATGLRLRLATAQLDQRMDAMAESPVPVDAPAVRQWMAETQPLVLADAELAP